MAKVDDNYFPKVIYDMQTTNPAAPTDRSWKVYSKADGVYARSSNTIVGPFGTGSVGNPVGYEYDYAQLTTTTNITATTEGTADTILTGNAVAYDGSTVILVEFYADYWEAAAGTNTRLYLYDGSSSIGNIALQTPPATLARIPVYCARRLTPSNASHTYSIRGQTDSGTAKIGAGSGGNGNVMPAFIRITKVA